MPDSKVKDLAKQLKVSEAVILLVEDTVSSTIIEELRKKIK